MQRKRKATEETVAEKIERLDRENAALRKERESLRMDCEILRKAEAFVEMKNGGKSR